MTVADITLLAMPYAVLVGLWSYPRLARRLGMRRAARNRRQAASVLATTFVGTCGHTIGVPADLPPVLACPACGRSYVQTLVVVTTPEPAAELPTEAQLEQWRQTFAKLAATPAPETERQLGGMRQSPPEEVFETIGPDGNDDETEPPPALVVVPNLAGEDITDVSDEIDTSDIEETA